MNPRLVALAGPLKESIVALTGTTLSVGREPANLLAISDPSISRRHCAIDLVEGRYRIRDLESRNGTYVNGTAVKESWLNENDQISVGDSVFIFLTQEEADTTTGQVEFDDSQLAHATAQLRPQDVLYLQPDRILREVPMTLRLGRNFW